MTKLEHLNEIAIDSFKLRLKVSSLKAYDSSLTDHLTVVNTNTGDIEKEFKRSSKSYECKGYTYYASYNENVRVSKSQNVDCITILINSKQLRSKYLQGITANNIKAIYKEVVSLGIIDCTYDTFINGTVSDVDFKIDFRLQLDEYKELLSTCKIMTKASSDRDKGCTSFSKSNNIGISWSVRASSKYKTHPYLKFYHKEIELKNNSRDFYDEYLQHLDITDRIRVETTVKNKSHFKVIGVDSNSLKDVLNLSKEQKSLILSTAINSHLSPRNKSLTFKSKIDMRPSDKILLRSIVALTTELNWSIDKVQNYLLSDIESKVSKSRNRTKIKELYTDQINGTDYDFKSSKIDSVLDALGWH